jgi:hypothetical protein
VAARVGHEDGWRCGDGRKGESVVERRENILYFGMAPLLTLKPSSLRPFVAVANPAVHTHFFRLRWLQQAAKSCAKKPHALRRQGRGRAFSRFLSLALANFHTDAAASHPHYVSCYGWSKNKMTLDRSASPSNQMLPYIINEVWTLVSMPIFSSDACSSMAFITGTEILYSRYSRLHRRR